MDKAYISYITFPVNEQTSSTTPGIPSIIHVGFSSDYKTLLDALLLQLSTEYNSHAESSDKYGDLPYDENSPFTEFELKSHKELRSLWNVIERTPDSIKIVDKLQNYVYTIERFNGSILNL